MDEESMARKTWEHLLATGGYSIGLFSVTVEDDLVRIYHYRTQEVHHFRKEDSYRGMQELCEERGYDLPLLLKFYYPKSFRTLTNYGDAR